MKVIDLIVRTGLRDTKSEARRLIRQSGFRMNNIVISDETADVFFFGSNKKWIVVEKKRILEFEADGSIFETTRNENDAR